MAETVSIIKNDKRLGQIFDQIIRLANADFDTPGTLSEQGDDLDSIIVGLNLLGEEIEAYTLQIRESEEKIKNTLILLTEAQHLSHIGSWEWVIATNEITWTDELYKIYGRYREDFKSNFENFIACIHPDDRDYVIGVIQKVYQEKKPFSFSYRVVHPDDGNVRILDCSGSVYVDKTGSLIRITVAAQDVTDLRKVEEKATRLAAIVESSHDAIISNTIEGYITSWNRQAETLFGYQEKEVLGKHISLLFPPDRSDEEEQILLQVRNGKALTNYETERVKKDETRVYVEVTISPIKEPLGKIIGVSNIVRDITRRKQVEEKLLAYTKVLEQKNKETEQFAYIASHDLQEPLRTITNYIGLFQEDYKEKLDKNADLYLGFIMGASLRMKTLISNLLDYTRIEDDRTQTEIDCNAVICEILSDFEVTIAENNAVIEFENLPVISDYPTRIRSLFQNLISNALKFRKANVDPVIQISAKDIGKEWLFEVRDNGIGIENIYFAKIFMLFQRLHARTEYQGTGIGLAHCKKIIDLRGGRIWVESEPGKGSSFYFTLPKKIIL